ncbi:MAG: beta-galactosidase [Candidatus Hydrogenedentes bacterium]|nr:beta-galactosidase [Candidatus Hydrogenedentota bacterium]
MGRFNPPYLGAAYYPEVWPLEQVDEDVRLMVDVGLNVARLAEFAWSSLEPEEGRVELDWLRRVVDKLGEAGIATILCTPSCTPPAWLTEKYPEVMVVDYRGVRAQHGSRRHVCPLNPAYRDLCGRITARLGETFGRDERVIGWQIDNEVHVWEGWGCYCPHCMQAFRDELRRRFRDIGKLNEGWGTNLWSQTYQTFKQIPAPRPGVCHHPSLLAAWARFQNESLVDYVRHQADILHRHVTQPVGTDMMPILEVSYEQMHRSLDLVQYNHYDGMEDLWRQVFWMDYVRPVMKSPFWNTETSTCWNGGTSANGYREPGFCRANSWLPIALGGEANLYWLWRGHRSGQELMHGSVISTCGRPMHVTEEVREVSAGFSAAKDFINGTRPAGPGIAVHLSSLAWTHFRFQPVAPDLDYVGVMQEKVYRPMMAAHLRADIVDPSAALDGYRVVFSPLLPALDEGGLQERLRSWIEGGGTWIAGPLTDIRTIEGTKPTGAPFKYLEEWTGVSCRYELPGAPRDFRIEWADGVVSQGSVWYAGLEPGAAEAWAVYGDGPLKGLAAVTESGVGKGKIIVLGTLPRPEELTRLLLRIAAGAGIYPAAEASSNVLVVPRKGSAGSGFIVVEVQNEKGKLTLPAPAYNLLDCRAYSGEVELHPYQVMVLRQ